jgi:mxaJ protein
MSSRLAVADESPPGRHARVPDIRGARRRLSSSPPSRVLRVCADPNNLPYSNRAGEGFENRIAELLAADRHASLDYTWWPQRRGFVRNTLNTGACDVVMGVPAALELTSTTRPYYRSSYMFVSRRDRRLGLHSFDDPRLRELRIGVQMIGDDFANSPPAHALSSRGIVRNVVGYSVYGDYAQPRPCRRSSPPSIAGTSTRPWSGDRRLGTSPARPRILSSSIR